MKPFVKSGVYSLLFTLCMLLYYVDGNKTQTNNCFFKCRTRQNSNCYGCYYDVDSAISRAAGGIPIGNKVCVFHKQKIIQENKRCSCPSTWGHSKKLHKYPIPQRLYGLFDKIGKEKDEYRSGTQWCNKCKEKAEVEFEKLGGLDPKPKRQVR